jgi:ribose transport system permease protein
MQQYGVLAAFLLLIVIFSILQPAFLSARNLSNIALQSSVNAVIALGMMMVIATAGIDLSVGSIVAFTGVVSTSFMMVYGLSPLVAVPAGLLLGLLCGLLQGVLIAKGHIPPFIATLGGLSFFRGLALLYTDGRPVIGAPESFRQFFAGDVVGVPTPWLIVVLLGVVFYFIVNRTVFGESVLALGGNEEAARLSGINTSLVKMTVYAISGFCAALGGMILTARLGSAEPIAGAGYELNAIAAVVIGGTSLFGGQARVVGTIVGALIIGGLRNGLTVLNVSTFMQQVVVGVVVVLAVFVDQLGRRRS